MVFCSDTNIWLDLEEFGVTHLPFRSAHEFWMYQSAIEDEILSPPDLGRRLIEYGLKGIDITIEELYLAGGFRVKYKALSQYDAVALAIAKERKWLLLTGDGPLRKAAAREGVDIKGTLGLLDLLLEEKILSRSEYAEILEDSKSKPKIRWPKEAVELRLNQYDN